MPEVTEELIEALYTLVFLADDALADRYDDIGSDPYATEDDIREDRARLKKQEKAKRRVYEWVQALDRARAVK